MLDYRPSSATSNHEAWAVTPKGAPPIFLPIDPILALVILAAAALVVLLCLGVTGRRGAP